jgi:hypothetical protein
MSSVGMFGGGSSPIRLRLTRKRKADDVETIDSDQTRTASSSVQTAAETVEIRSVVRLSERIGAFLKKGNSVLDQPIYIGRLENVDIWEEYCQQDHVPLLPKYVFLDEYNLDLYIIELPTDKHEFLARNILLQMRDECKYIESVGSGRRNHIEADERICPSALTPNLQLSQGVEMQFLSTVVIEVGLSQKWTGKGGLDDKARRWFLNRNALGLQYILCVKIDMDMNTRAITDVSYKLYDLLIMQNFSTFAAKHLNLQQNAADAQIQLDARRVLSIPVNQPLPQGFNGNTFIINLETSRDATILKGC